MKFSIYRTMKETGNGSILVAWLLLRLIAIIYLAAFASLTVQITGLVGVDGILPAGEYLNQAKTVLGSHGQWEIPTRSIANL